MKQRITEILVIGSGIAGLYYALHCAEFASVLLVTKSKIGDSNTMYAQGGIAAVIDSLDSTENHVQDTLITGDGLCDEAAVRLLVERAPECIRDLERMHVHFDKTTTGIYDLHREGGHSHPRVVHSADATGREVENSLVNRARATSNLTILEHHFVRDLIVVDQTCSGACVFDLEAGTQIEIRAKIVMLASGGGSQIYLHNTNPRIATGDGFAIAARAGAELMNMEFVQFHPTTLYSSSPETFLISEAVRGFGAELKLKSGQTFMERYHPMKSLAPRDVVSRAIHDEMHKSGEPCVYLDLRSFDSEEIQKHFPNIFRRCVEEGLNLQDDMIPVVPAAHYFCGGVRTDLQGRSTIHNLYACGEVACTGVHGANRLASNSLLEGLVFAGQAANDARLLLPAIDVGYHTECNEITVSKAVDDRVAGLRQRVQSLMWENAGIARSEQGLQFCYAELSSMQNEISGALKLGVTIVHLMELRNMIETALMIVMAALRRPESAGCHWREDASVGREHAMPDKKV